MDWRLGTERDSVVIELFKFNSFRTLNGLFCASLVFNVCIKPLSSLLFRVNVWRSSHTFMTSTCNDLMLFEDVRLTTPLHSLQLPETFNSLLFTPTMSHRLNAKQQAIFKCFSNKLFKIVVHPFGAYHFKRSLPKKTTKIMVFIFFVSGKTHFSRTFSSYKQHW